MRGQRRAMGENDAFGLSQACARRLPWMCQPLVRVSAACTTCIKQCPCPRMLQTAPKCCKMLQNQARLNSWEMVVDKLTARGRSIKGARLASAKTHCVRMRTKYHSGTDFLSPGETPVCDARPPVPGAWVGGRAPHSALQRH